MSAIRRWLWLADLILLIGLGAYIFAGTDRVPFHGDESTFVWLSTDYVTLFQRGDAAALAFRERPLDGTRQFNWVMTGPINPMTIGLAWNLAGFKGQQINEPWIWNQAPNEWTYNVQHMTVPAPDLLYVARIPSTLLTIASLILLFLIARRVSGSRWAAWTAAILYATSPGVLVNGRRAMQEGAMLFGTALIILVALGALRALRQPEKRAALLAWTVALGAAIGFGMACKHTSAIIGIAALLAVLIAPWLRREGDGVPFDRTHFLRVVGAGFVTVLVFYALMPVWWSAGVLLGALGLAVLVLSFAAGFSGVRVWVVRGAALLILLIALEAQPTGIADLFRIPFFMLDQRHDLVDVQSEQYGDVQDLGSRLSVLAEDAFFPTIQYFEDPMWAGFDVTTAEIKAYEASGLAGRSGWAWGVLQIGLVLAGLAGLLPRWREGQSWLLALWLAVPATVLLLTNPLPWQRYYILLHAPIAVLAGLGLATLIAAIQARVGHAGSIGGLNFGSDSAA
jgi:hypothetical protein